MLILSKLLRKIFIIPITLYQYILSPLIPISCRFEPPCSHYSKEAILKHGIMKGIILTIKRISRCHPWGGSGHDPVP